MSIDELIDLVRNGKEEIQADWMPATGIRALVHDDPSLIWLDYFGEANGFKPEKSSYDFLAFIGGKGRQFEEKWISELASTAVLVCGQDYEVRSIEKVIETIGHLHAGVPAIAKPALWWGQERIYGVPDLVVHTSWLEEKFLKCMTSFEKNTVAANLFTKPGHYIAFDIKFTTGLDGSDKKVDYANYSAQVRIYSYMLGQLQGVMPRNAYLVTRDRLLDPLALKITSTLGQPIDAKDTIARERFPGRDPALLYQVSPSIKQELKDLGFPSLDSLLGLDPVKIPFEKCKGLGPKRSKVMRAILQANRSGKAISPSSALAPVKKQYEFFVDFEYLTNVNVDFERQWPTLEGREMVFMVGVGEVTNDKWSFKSFVSAAESSEQEREMFHQFIQYLDQKTKGCTTDPSRTVLYHWTSAEVWQSRRSSDRQSFDADHPLRKLPWFDLQKPFHEGPAAVPEAWGYGLKEIAKALGKLYPEIGVNWPEGLDEGLRAMVMGWRAYTAPRPLESAEMAVLNTYLEIDCMALFSVLRWLRL